MSLSQKHAGLILVPWYNADEWRYVYQLTYSHIKDNQLEALKLLKIWKMRTPILSTGVEGTLILLDVLLVDNESLPDEQITNLYAVALMRFLNLSAANSEKQGSFTKTSAKNELPKWLTNLRHDIAHGHQIPSKYNLQMGLDFGFNWLREKYWDPHSKVVNDYHICDESKFDDTLVNSLQFYVDVNINLFEKTNLDDELYESVKNIIHKKYKKKNINPHLILDIFLQMIRQNLEKEHGIEIVEQCLDVLVSTKALLRDNIDPVSENGGTGKMNEKFLKIWTNVINLFHHYEGMLFCLINRLFDVIGGITQSEQSKKMASLWINAIFLSLEMIREPNVSNEDWILHLERNEHAYTEESLEFQNKVLYCSADKTAPHMTTILDSLLRYNLSNTGFSSDALNLLKVNSAVENIHEAGERIYTVDDLMVNGMEMEDVEFSEPNEGAKIDSCNKNVAEIVGESRWKRIEDAAAFKNCPLGVLPHQINSRHPFLIFA